MDDDEPKITRIPLNQFLAASFESAFGITREQAWGQGICVSCKKEPTFYSEAGVKEYRLSALCEPCFDELMAEPEEQE